MPSVNLQEKVERAQRVLARTLGYCAAPVSDTDYQQIKLRLREAHMLAVAMETVLDLSDDLGFSRSYTVSFKKAIGEYSKTAFGTMRTTDRLLSRLVMNHDRMVSITKSLDSFLWAQNRSIQPIDMLCAHQVIDIAFSAAERLDELRDTEIVTRVLTAA